MATNSAVGHMMGRAPGENGPTAIRVLLDFATGLSQRYDALGQTGSAFAQYNYQAIFVDNSARAESVRVTCDGTLLSYTVPARSQAFLPIACPPGSLGLTFEVATLGGVVPIQLLDTPIPYIVWSALPYDTPAVALMPDDGSSLLASLTTNATVGSYITMFQGSGARQGAAVFNAGTSPLYIRDSVSTPGTGSAASFVVQPGANFIFPFAPKKRYWARSDAASQPFTVTVW